MGILNTLHQMLLNTHYSLLSKDSSTNTLLPCRLRRTNRWELSINIHPCGNPSTNPHLLRFPSEIISGHQGTLFTRASTRVPQLYSFSQLQDKEVPSHHGLSPLPRYLSPEWDDPGSTESQIQFCTLRKANALTKLFCW